VGDRLAGEATPPAVSLDNATLLMGARPLWEGLDLRLAAGEFLAILGPNGAGKTTFLRVLLGLQALTSGTVTVLGGPPRRGTSAIGYIAQQKAMDRDLRLRGRDLVRLGLDGHRWGWSLPSRQRRRVITDAVVAVGADQYADRAVGELSGGEQQRLRVAQALVSRPRLLLCDEPLSSLDLHHQHAVMSLIDRYRTDNTAAVVLVTHDLNPVLPVVDRVLYLVGGRWAVGRPEQVMTSERLSALYGSPIDVLRVRDRIVVVGTDEAAPHCADEHAERHEDRGAGLSRQGGAGWD
jgi:zinc/manganese transport system ATP-binding protein